MGDRPAAAFDGIDKAQCAAPQNSGKRRLHAVSAPSDLAFIMVSDYPATPDGARKPNIVTARIVRGVSAALDPKIAGDRMKEPFGVEFPAVQSRNQCSAGQK